MLETDVVPARRRSRARRPIVPDLNNNTLALRSSLNHSLLGPNAPLVASTRDLVRVTLGKLFDWLGGWGWTTASEVDVRQLTNGIHADGTAAEINPIGQLDTQHAVPEEAKGDLQVNAPEANYPTSNNNVNIVEGNSRLAEQWARARLFLTRIIYSAPRAVS